MSFGRDKKDIREISAPPEFDVYKHCKEKWGLDRKDIYEIKRVKTYKNYIEYTVFFTVGEFTNFHRFKIVNKGKDYENRWGV